MIERYSLVRGRILQELDNLAQVVKRVNKGMERARQNPTDKDLFLDAVALNLHDFYSGLERVFQYIAAHIDQNLPSGGNWHRELLRQMQQEISDLRPAVLSAGTVEKLEEYLRFRHVVRNVYAFQFDMERLEPLVNNLNPTFDRVKEELIGLTNFIDAMIDDST
jgi:hypothetical protein